MICKPMGLVTVCTKMWTKCLRGSLKQDNTQLSLLFLLKWEHTHLLWTVWIQGRLPFHRLVWYSYLQVCNTSNHPTQQQPFPLIFVCFVVVVFLFALLLLYFCLFVWVCFDLVWLFLVFFLWFCLLVSFFQWTKY